MTEAKFDDYRSLKASLEKALAECQRLREENAQLKFRLGITSETIVQATGQLFEDNIEQVQETNTNINVTKYSAPEKKIHLFRSLFRGRRMYIRLDGKGKAGKKDILRLVPMNGRMDIARSHGSNVLVVPIDIFYR